VIGEGVIVIENLRLQPLAIPCGWEVIINNFYVLDPEPTEERTWDHLFMYFDTQLFWAVNGYQGFVIDLTWYPPGDQSGEFCLDVIGKEHKRPFPKKFIKVRKGNQVFRYRLDYGSTFEDSSYNVIFSFRSRCREAVVSKMNRIFYDISNTAHFADNVMEKLRKKWKQSNLHSQ
jgi:hypothetical protein